MGMDFDAAVFIPFETFRARLRRTDRVQRYLAVVSPGQESLAVSEALKDFLSARTGNPDSYRVMSPASLAAMLTGITSTLNIFLTGVAAISLLVGGVGIMNIMLVSVTERTKEIGIRKALGASSRRIMEQFLIEAVALTLAGGTIGVGVGVGLSAVATAAFSWEFSLSPSSIFVALGFSSLVGLFFGWYPAARAARLDPVAALMYE
jgi:putative ABC transport system permease protein